VPQWSVLGPFLFLIYVNELPCLIKSKIKLFADNTKMWRVIKSDSYELQHSVDKLQQWSDIWNKLNVNKCKFVCYGRNRSTQGNYYMKINDTNLILEQLDSFKDLGVIFDNQLSFQQHFYDKINKAYSI